MKEYTMAGDTKQALEDLAIAIYVRYAGYSMRRLEGISKRTVHSLSNLKQSSRHISEELW